jgi:class 3 adenylate cyclase
VGAYITILANIPYLPLIWKTGSSLWGAVLTAFLCAMGIGIWLRSRRKHWLATTFILCACLGWIGGSLVVFGTGQHPHVYFVAVCVAALFVYPPSQALTMWVIVAAGGAAFVASMLVGAIPPMLDLGADATSDRVMNLVGFTLVLIAVAAYERWVVDTVEGKLDEERQRSESLLRNVLPESIAARLKSDSAVIADSLEDATVLFADLVGFTVLSGTLSPEKVVEMLNETFRQFDDLAERHDLEKIKTIGDAYMVAGGLPERREGHVEAVAQMALDMLGVVRQLETPNGVPLELRIGIHTGPVVAGVIGKKKFSYDLWGDTVNTASRMESHGETGRVQVTEAVYERLKHRFELEPRGLVHIKGKGDMSTWWLGARAKPCNEVVE